jgi:hypothetical protein
MFEQPTLLCAQFIAPKRNLRMPKPVLAADLKSLTRFQPGDAAVS